MDPTSPLPPAYPKRGSSKYDFVKLRVHLSSQHYYVLSRFLVSRMLMATKVSVLHSTRIALDLKKRLVDRGALDVSQLELEQALFQLMAEKGYGQRSIRLFWTLNRLHHQRIPLVILIGGAGSVGKSTLATQLAERLNLANTLKTDLICEMTRSLLGLPEIRTIKMSTDFVSSSNNSDACTLVRRGLEIELRKCLSSGKSVIVEGEHVDVTLLNFVLRCLDDERFNRKRRVSVDKLLPPPSSLMCKQGQLAKNDQHDDDRDHNNNNNNNNASSSNDSLESLGKDHPYSPSIHRNYAQQPSNAINCNRWSDLDVMPHGSNSDIYSHSYSETDSFESYSSSASSAWGDEEDAPLGIVVPFLLTINDADFHRELIEETTRSFGGIYTASTTIESTNLTQKHGAVERAWLQRERTRQNTLLEENSNQPAPLRQFITIVRNRETAHDTLDCMHDTVLGEIAATL
ncbi:hypothetical protein BDF19DRAFT_436269 [Syncephalis fuscata]|nr:hypothetical protein BDF19DRAFT_436269 [Syncephalis fuscata]